MTSQAQVVHHKQLLWWLLDQVAFFSHLGFLGVYPWHFSGLLGVVTGLLVHGDWVHLMSNTFLFLSGAIYFFYPKIANQVFIQFYLLTGLLV